MKTLQRPKDKTNSCHCRHPVRWIAIDTIICVRCSGRLNQTPPDSPLEQLSLLEQDANR